MAELEKRNKVGRANRPCAFRLNAGRQFGPALYVPFRACGTAVAHLGRWPLDHYAIVLS